MSDHLIQCRDWDRELESREENHHVQSSSSTPTYQLVFILLPREQRNIFIQGRVFNKGVLN